MAGANKFFCSMKYTYIEISCFTKASATGVFHSMVIQQESTSMQEALISEQLLAPRPNTEHGNERILHEDEFLLLSDNLYI